MIQILIVFFLIFSNTIISDILLQDFYRNKILYDPLTTELIF